MFGGALVSSSSGVQGRAWPTTCFGAFAARPRDEYYKA